MKIRILSLFITISAMASAQTPADTIADQSLHEVTVKARRPGVTNLDGALNGHNISRAELFKAACCNLGESFSTNPSVDVSYNDAATGARQIKLLGLAGTYVQMLTEQLPNFRGAATPYALGYVPGPWMKSIQVSKGSASVKNGYESITGQINVEYLKPEDEQAVEVNLFGDSKSRIEANAAANLHVGERAGGNLMLHYENSINNHDENHDGFYDKPRVEQYNAQSRWLWKGDRYIFHGGLSGLKEKRRGGQTGHGMAAETPLFGIAVNTDRYEAYAKNAFIINPEHATNVALMASGSMHETDAVFGGKTYYVNEKNAYVSLMFETNFSERHNLSAGLSLNHPFTHPKDEDIPLLDTDPAAVRADAYDMVVNGVEVGGGSIRIHDSKLQAKMFEILGFTPEKAQEQFGFLMNAFKYGAPPHGGLAYGLDRWVSLFAGLDSIRDCIAFPKNNSGRDVMLDAPAPLDQKQIDELNLVVDLKD
jgi:hypothetical protein